jgi:hypothetical protein
MRGHYALTSSFPQRRKDAKKAQRQLKLLLDLNLLFFISVDFDLGAWLDVRIFPMFQKT